MESKDLFSQYELVCWSWFSIMLSGELDSLAETFTRPDSQNKTKTNQQSNPTKLSKVSEAKQAEDERDQCHYCQYATINVAC